MDLHSLTLRAIGPYAGQFTIDFHELGASGIFLLEGPTGSGKSTIIDALVFGLYGSLAGATSSVDRLHSHHAAPDIEPFVELVFETASGIYRIRRTPQWHRPKSRGVGTTKANASATLVRLTSPDAPEGQPMSSSTQEIGSEIAAITGLTREQFVQTVVLPQGEFARFLASSGEDRRLVLQSLFGTQIYDRTTEVLAELRRGARGEVESAQRAVDEALASLRGAAGDDELTASGAADTIAAFAVSASEAERARDDARAVRDAAERHRVGEVRLAESLARRAELLRRREVLRSASAAVDEQRMRAELGRRSASVAAPATAHASALDTLDRAAATVAAREASYPELAALDDGALAAHHDELLGERAALASAVALEAAFDTRRSALDRSAESLDTEAARLVDDERRLDARGAERAAIAAEWAASAAGAERLGAAERGVVEIVAILEAVRERDGLAAAREAAAGQVAASSSAARTAVDVESALRRRRIDGMAGELAAQLVAGEPCAVCGSPAHPSPRTLTVDHPSDDEVDRAADERTMAEGLLQQRRDALATVTARLDEVARRAGSVGSDELQVRLAAAHEALAEATAAVTAEGAGRLSLQAFDARTSLLDGTVQALRLRLAALSERLEGERRTLAADRRHVAEQLAGRAVSCVELAQRLGSEQALAAVILEARRAHARARDDARERGSELHSAIEAARFGTLAEADSARLEQSELAALDQGVAAHDRDVAVVDEQLARDDVASLSGDEQVDLVFAASAASEADARLTELAAAASLAVDRSARAARALAALDVAILAGETASSEARAIVRMADVTAANGPENLRGITLGTYVLLRRFDDVVAAANGRLAVMSSGRYQLEASDSRESGSRSRKTGLALVIRDNATGTTRDPKSFSGGETFYASLSLALGLADVVQAEAGGIDLGTLFVDEGFGTLDPETLDAVMSELGRLSAGGRVVGIVSHVDELKQRIADRIEVRRRPDGSSTLRSTAGR